VSRKSKKRAKQAIPEEILAEGSGPNAEAAPDATAEDAVVEADAQALADAAADALASAEIGEVEAQVEAVAMAAEVVVVAAEAARAEERDKKASKKKRGRKAEPVAEPEVKLDAWGQPILVDDEPAPPEVEAEAAEVEAESDAESVESIEAAADASAEDETSEDLDDAEVEATASDENGEPVDDELAADGDELAADGEVDATAEGGEGDAEGATLPTSAATLDPQALKNLVEALVFAADKPVTIQRLRQLTRVSDVRRLEAALAELAEDYKARGIALTVVSGGYQFRTNTHYSGYVQQLIAGRPVRLSRAQLETLAIIAYRQPITRPEIDEIRGVDSSSTLKVLLDRALIRILGKREEAGRPTLYGTTKEFLDFFSLGDLRELPTLREYSELTAESRKVVSDRLGVGLEGAPADDATPTDEQPAADMMADAPADVSDEQPIEALDEQPAADMMAESPMEMAVEAFSEAPAEQPVADMMAESPMEMAVEAFSEPPAEQPVGDMMADAPAEVSDEQPIEASDEPPMADMMAESPMEMAVEAFSEAPAELADDSHVGVEPELSAASSPEITDEPELAAGSSAEIADEPHVEPTEEHVELTASPDADADQAELAAEPAHGFIDPDEIAGRVVAGESDAAVHNESASELEASAAGETADHAHEASDPDATDTSAPDDPAVD
jgi:segregation and condensation protein B